MLRDPDGRPDRLLVWTDAASPPQSEDLNPPVPKVIKATGPMVALVDSGINYRLEGLADRLARKDDGSLIGYDHWDQDDRPFDADFGRDPLFPVRHGTLVGHILVAEAPGSLLAPFRYPRPDMTRFADLVDDIAEAGIRIVAMPMGSNRASDWQTFLDAAKRVPDILFVVSAGNDGRDIETQPVWPAAALLDNLIVVTSADDFGRLAQGSNWGAVSVDIMVPGERVSTVDHRGVEVKASGSSFAVPRVAALLARWLEADPELNARDLRERLFARARPLRGPDAGKLRHGWVPDPTDDFIPAVGP